MLALLKGLEVSPRCTQNRRKLVRFQTEVTGVLISLFELHSALTSVEWEAYVKRTRFPFLRFSE